MKQFNNSIMIQYLNLITFEGKRAGSSVVELTFTSCPDSSYTEEGGTRQR